MNKMTATEQATKLLQNIKKGKEVHDIFAANFTENYLIRGKTLQNWEKHFRLTVPGDPSPPVCKKLDMDIMKLYQEASLYHALADAHVQALKKGTETQYRIRYTAIVAEWKALNPDKRAPSAATLDTLTRAETDDIDSALANAELQKSFFKNMMDYLNMCRRLLENATINSGIQVKMDINHKGNLYG